MSQNLQADRSQPEFDLVLFGVTGYTGRQAYRYLAKAAPAGLRWAVAGRDRAALDALRAQYPASDQDPELLFADYRDAASIERMAAGARVVVNFAGPYAQFSETLIQACVEQETDYVDIGGETFFIKRMIEKYHRKARLRGVKIIPVCGYESLPFDLLTLLATKFFDERFSERCANAKIVTNFTRSLPIVDNRISGGSLGTMKSIVAGDVDNSYNDPTCLVPSHPKREVSKKLNRVSYKARHDPDVGTITAPLYPAPFLNVPVVLRSAHLLRSCGEGYAEPFQYSDKMKVDFFADTPRDIPKQARKLARQYRVTSLAMSLPKSLRGFLRRRLDKIDLNPGDGPCEEALECVDYELELFATSETGRKIKGRLSARGHPGYLSTAKIAVEAGIALAIEREHLTSLAGILTPASGLGLGVAERMKRAGLSFWIEYQSETYPAPVHQPGARSARRASTVP